MKKTWGKAKWLFVFLSGGVVISFLTHLSGLQLPQIQEAMYGVNPVAQVDQSEMPSDAHTFDLSVFPEPKPGYERYVIRLPKKVSKNGQDLTNESKVALP